MKKLLSLAISAFLAVSVSACSAEETPATQVTIQQIIPEKAPDPAPVVSTEEKKVPEKKRVCIMVWDAKQQKEIQKCRTLRIHEKKEGTTVPK